MPIEQNHKINYKERSAKVDGVQNQMLVEKLIYLTNIRLNLAYEISMVSPFMHNARVRHSQVVDHVIQYLKVTLKRILLFKNGRSLTMETYIDVDYAILVIDRMSISCYCTLLCKNHIVWRSKKQSVFPQSINEA